MFKKFKGLFNLKFFFNFLPKYPTLGVEIFEAILIFGLKPLNGLIRIKLY